MTDTRPLPFRRKFLTESRGQRPGNADQARAIAEGEK